MLCEWTYQKIVKCIPLFQGNVNVVIFCRGGNSRHLCILCIGVAAALSPCSIQNSTTRLQRRCAGLQPSGCLPRCHPAGLTARRASSDVTLWVPALLEPPTLSPCGLQASRGFLRCRLPGPSPRSLPCDTNGQTQVVLKTAAAVGKLNSFLVSAC